MPCRRGAMEQAAADFLAFSRFWAPTLGKGVWEAWLAKQERRQSSLVMPDFEPFVDNTGTLIKGRQHWREHLKKNNLVELSHSDLPDPRNYRNPVTRKIDPAGRKEGIKLALDKIVKYKRPTHEVRAILENVVKANRRK